mmetsp:Transcript_9382/g.41142  ORF Transcript_9382/g.41142 Transcript_9382/m.41142 type:complete len:240 (-) Transcript_9382:1205-1924(-)
MFRFKSSSSIARVDHHGQVTERHGPRAGPDEHHGLPAVLLAHLPNRAFCVVGIGGQHAHDAAASAPRDLRAKHPAGSPALFTQTHQLVRGVGTQAACPVRFVRPIHVVTHLRHHEFGDGLVVGNLGEPVANERDPPVFHHRVRPAGGHVVGDASVDGRDVVAVPFGVHHEEVLAAETTRQRPVDQHHLQPPGIKLREVRNSLLRPRPSHVLPEHKRRAPNPAVVALPVVAVPHAAVDAP